jgi:hypothetical protein
MSIYFKTVSETNSNQFKGEGGVIKKYLEF